MKGLPSSSGAVLRALADPERLAVAGQLARGSRSLDDLVAELGLPTRRVGRHLARLAAAGIVREVGPGRTYALVPDALRESAREVGPPREAGSRSAPSGRTSARCWSGTFAGAGSSRSRRGGPGAWSSWAGWPWSSRWAADTRRPR